MIRTQYIMKPSRSSVLAALFCSAVAPCDAFWFSLQSSSASKRSLVVVSQSGSSSNFSRRNLFDAATIFVVGGTVGTLTYPAIAHGAPGAPTAAELNRIKVGYDGIQYLLNNFDQETTTCKVNGGECKRDADAVRKYLGLRSTTDPLFQIEKVFNKVKYMDLDPDKLDAFFEATEVWNSCMNMSNSMAFISQFAEYNPGGGKDEVLKYLNEAKTQVSDAEKALKVIIDCLDIA